MKYWIKFNIGTFTLCVLGALYAPDNTVVWAGAWVVGAVVSAIVFSREG